MPVTTQIRSFVGDYDQVKCARGDGQITARAEVFLDSLVGLDGCDCDLV